MPARRPTPARAPRRRPAAARSSRVDFPCNAPISPRVPPIEFDIKRPPAERSRSVRFACFVICPRGRRRQLKRCFCASFVYRKSNRRRCNSGSALRAPAALPVRGRGRVLRAGAWGGRRRAPLTVVDLQGEDVHPCAGSSASNVKFL
jgi:hypothetical protein